MNGFLPIRQAQPEDKPSWLALRRALWPHCSDHRHELEMHQVLQSGGVVFLAEGEHAQRIGFAEVSLRRDQVPGASITPVPYLEAWFVQAGYRNQGVGRALLVAVESWAVSRGYTELASDAELANSSAIRFHQQLGFVEVDRTVTFLKPLKTSGETHGIGKLKEKPRCSTPGHGLH